MLEKIKSHAFLLATTLMSATLLSSVPAHASPRECKNAWRNVNIALAEYQQECLRNGTIICSNSRLTYHYNRIENLRATARRLCSS